MNKSYEVGVKLYLNGFPKSGTHAINSLAVMVLPQMALHNWLGNLTKHAFSTKLHGGDVEGVLDNIPPGKFLKGHMAYTPEVAEAFQRNAFCKTLIFRDFRDVAVSATFHALGKDNHFPNIDFYQTLEFDEVLKRIITGDETIDGVMERWETFAPWMNEDWVLKIAYEDFLEHKEGVAKLFLRYLYGRTASYMGINVELDSDDFLMAVDRLLLSMNNPEKSATYRSGKIGKWKKYFTDEHKELFKESDKNNWLIRLGYTNDRNW